MTTRVSTHRRQLCQSLAAAAGLASMPATLVAATPPSVPGSTGIGPLKLDAIRLSFGIPDNGPTTIFVKAGEAMPSFKAVVRYAGGGTLVGRWELVSPADAAIDETTLLPESQMSATERGNLRRFELLDTFSVLLPPLLGSYTLTGPSLRAETLKLVGAYRIVLRIEDASSSGAVVSQKRLAVTPLRLHMLGAPAPAPTSAPTAQPELSK